MNILLPWNTSYFIPLNAFHPLYSGILESSGKFRYIVPKRNLGLEQYRHLLAGGVYEKYFLNKIWWLKLLPKSAQDKFYSFYSLREINYVDKLPGDIEILHTAPITAGNRDFIFHCESFLPMFMPFIFQGDELDPKLILKIKGAYENLFTTRCLAIVSHNKKTLNEISVFFDSQIIDNLLCHIDIGVTKSKQVESVNGMTIFLFVASAHQNSNNFLFRGGFISVNIALAILSHNQNCKFIFRCAKPKHDDFIKNSIDTELLLSAERVGCIVWLETRLPQNQLDKLVARADFLLLPSASLHSDSVLSAMQYKTIPVVTDIPGYEIYLNDRCAVIVNGVRSKVCDSIFVGDININIDNYDSFIDIQSEVANSGATKLIRLLEDKDKINNLKEELFKCYEAKFRGDMFIDKFESILEKNRIKNIEMVRDQDLTLGESYIEDLSVSWFETCPQPLKIANTGHGIIRKTFKDILYVPYWRESELSYLESFSVLNYVHEQYSSAHKGNFIIKKVFNDLIIPLINMDEELYQPSDFIQGIKHHPKLHFKYWLAGKLRHNAYLFTMAQKLYRYLRMKEILN